MRHYISFIVVIAAMITDGAFGQHENSEPWRKTLDDWAALRSTLSTLEGEYQVVREEYDPVRRSRSCIVRFYMRNQLKKVELLQDGSIYAVAAVGKKYQFELDGPSDEGAEFVISDLDESGNSELVTLDQFLDPFFCAMTLADVRLYDWAKEGVVEIQKSEDLGDRLIRFVGRIRAPNQTWRPFQIDVNREAKSAIVAWKIWHPTCKKEGNTSYSVAANGVRPISSEVVSRLLDGRMQFKETYSFSEPSACRRSPNEFELNVYGLDVPAINRPSTSRAIGLWITALLSTVALLIGVWGCKKVSQKNLNGRCRLVYFVVATIGTCLPVLFLITRPFAASPATEPKYRIEPSEIRLGSCSAGTFHRFSFQIFNTDNSPIKIMGGKSGCGYLLPDSLPIQIATGSAATISCPLRLRGEVDAQRKYRMWIKLISDKGWLKGVPVTFEVKPALDQLSMEHDEWQTIPVTME